ICWRNRVSAPHKLADAGNAAECSQRAVGPVHTFTPLTSLWVASLSRERDGIAALYRAARDYLGIDPHVRVIVLRRHTQDAGILRAVYLRHRGNDAARAGTGEPQVNLVAHPARGTEPAALNEAQTPPTA